MVRKLLVSVGLVVGATVVAATQSASPEPVPTRTAGEPSAHAQKAAHLFNLARFTEWPAGVPGRPILLCVLGDADVAEALDRLAGERQIAGRDIAVARLVSNRLVKTCHLLYFGGPDPAAHARSLDEVARTPVLTVGEGERFVRMGGIIGLVVDHGHTGFAVNTDAALRAGLKLSSKLLGLATVLKDERVQS